MIATNRETQNQMNHCHNQQLLQPNALISSLSTSSIGSLSELSETSTNLSHSFNNSNCNTSLNNMSGYISNFKPTYNEDYQFKTSLLSSSSTSSTSSSISNSSNSTSSRLVESKPTFDSICNDQSMPSINGYERILSNFNTNFLSHENIDSSYHGSYSTPSNNLFFFKL
jgi:hypothetical protein